MRRLCLSAVVVVLLVSQIIVMEELEADENSLKEESAGISKSRVKRTTSIFERILNALSLIMANQMHLMDLIKTSQTTPAPSGPYIDCTDVFTKGGKTLTGVYTITPSDGLGSLDVLCEMNGVSGGWTVIQSRVSVITGSGSDFYQNWAKYESGFGTIGPASNFWLGLENIYRLTKQGTYTLRIEIEKGTGGSKGAAMYSSFSIGGSATKYTLSIGDYSSGSSAGFVDAGDSLKLHNDFPFSTYDKDNDGIPNYNCAADQTLGGWWYIPYYCYKGDLNGITVWETFDKWSVLSTTKMMIKRV